MIDRLALCNEVLAPWGFAEQCAYAAKLGYRALEVAPFTLADDPMDISDTQAAQWAAIASDHGLAISGLHWLLVAPKGLSISHPDAAVRQRSDAVLARLIELCAQLGGSYLVHGSPAQRSPAAGPERGRRAGARHPPGSIAGERAGRFGRALLHRAAVGREQTSVFNTVDRRGHRQRGGPARPEDDAGHQLRGAGRSRALPALIDRVWPAATWPTCS
jgi:D-psicose/D-tagatose/L-ribulose 3-epimerase